MCLRYTHWWSGFNVSHDSFAHVFYADRKEQNLAYEEKWKQTRSADDFNHPIKIKLDELESVRQGFQDITGMTFQKADTGRLKWVLPSRNKHAENLSITAHECSCPRHRYVLKGLDTEDINREFSFLLSTDMNNLYRVEECQPPIPDDALADLIDEVNLYDDGMSLLVQGIRRMWLSILAEKDASE